MKVNTISLTGAKGKDVELNEGIFGLEARKDILARVVKWQLARRQTGNHKVKRRTELAYTRRKPFKQKGTGAHRQGFKGATHYRGGATVHGPVVRDHSHKLTKKFRALGLKTALSVKMSEGKLKVIDNLALSSNKTKELKTTLAGLDLQSVLFIDGASVNTNFALASRNLYKVDVLPHIGANVYDILNHDTLVLTEEAVRLLEERLA